MRSTMSLFGIYNYFPTLFDNFKLPDDIDRDTLINNLLIETAELEILYPDANFLQFAIGAWSNKEIAVWNKLVATTKYEYNPIHNYDRTETWKDTQNLNGTNNETRNLQGTNNETRNLQGSEDVTEIPNTTDTNTTKRAGFDSDTLHTQDEQTLRRTGTTDTNRNTTDTGTDNFISTDTGTINTTNTNKGTIEHEARMFGNIGVTSTQDMIKQEREIDLFNVYDIIIKSFINRFCLLIY